MLRIILIALAALASFPLAAEELIVRGDRLFVPVEVQGEPAEALLDSGAELTLLDRRFADQLGVQEGKQVEARGTGAGTISAELVENVDISALGRDFTLPVVAVIDLSDVAARLIGQPLPVILGREIFDAGKLAIDIDAGTIAFVAEQELPGGLRLLLTAAHGIETVPVLFGEMEVSADFDLGNGSGLLLSSELASQLKLEPVGIEPAGGIGGAAARPVVYVRELTLAGRLFRNIRAHVLENLQVPANVGVGILRRFRIVTDFPNRAIFLDPTS